MNIEQVIERRRRIIQEARERLKNDPVQNVPLSEEDRKLAEEIYEICITHQHFPTSRSK